MTADAPTPKDFTAETVEVARRLVMLVRTDHLAGGRGLHRRQIVKVLDPSMTRARYATALACAVGSGDVRVEGKGAVARVVWAKEA